MNIGTARAMFENLDNCSESMERKGLAIRMVLDMPTHNSVTKDQMLKAIDWMWHQIYVMEVEQDGEI